MFAEFVGPTKLMERNDDWKTDDWSKLPNTWIRAIGGKDKIDWKELTLRNLTNLAKVLEIHKGWTFFITPSVSIQVFEL